ncbi:MAG: arginine repressor [Clostridiales Family XIII bacterium]|jgi:transcriptional regulator of arginine metabolism|nr:arginine repressor [Clostridiales Family XIII bacterium]
MRYSRQNKILELIGSHEIDTQEKLAKQLQKSGYKVTQATVSRDIKELQLVKTMTSSGKYKYTANAGQDRPANERFVKIFRETVQSVEHSGNIIVIKTLSGCANAAAEAVDSLRFANILGSIAGDNTILLVADENASVAAIAARFNEMRTGLP